MKRLAIIPARGGSKRIPQKNIRDFCGNPMISYILETARKSQLFDVTHVSTESYEIRNVVEKLGFTIDFMRPMELADDFTPLMPVLRYVVDRYYNQGKSFNQVWLLMACSPLIRPQDLQNASKKFENAGGTFPLLAVSEYPVPVEWAFSLSEEGKLTPVQPGLFSTRSQDLGKKYYDTGSFAIFPSENVQESKGAGSDHGFIGYPLPKGSFIDIDDQEDWKIAEALFLYKSRS